MLCCSLVGKGELNMFQIGDLVVYKRDSSFYGLIIDVKKSSTGGDIVIKFLNKETKQRSVCYNGFIIQHYSTSFEKVS